MEVWSLEKKIWLMVRPKQLSDLTSPHGMFRKSMGGFAKQSFERDMVNVQDIFHIYSVKTHGAAIFAGVERHIPSVGLAPDSNCLQRGKRLLLAV